MNKKPITVYRHPDFIAYSIYTYDHKEFFVELNQLVCHGHSSLESAIQALNYQIT